LSDSVPIQNGIKQGDICFIATAFQLCLDYDIKMVQENLVRLKLNGRHQLLAYVDDMHLLGENVDALHKNRKFNLCQ
jgi:hypothetical protein